MANHYLPANPTDAAIETYLNDRVVIAIDSLVNFQTTNFGDIKAIVFEGVAFSRDDGDSTSVHNGTTILVDSQGTRFIASGFKKPQSIKGIINAPTNNPVVGDAYIISNNPSGIFAGHAKKIVVFTIWEWRVLTPQIGEKLYNQADKAYYHYSIDGNWHKGLGALGSQSVFPDSLIFPSNLIVNSIRNSPTSASTATLNAEANAGNPRVYLVSTNGTGAFQNHNNEIAIFFDSSWKFIAPKNGMEIVTASGVKYRWNGTAWIEIPNTPILENLTEIRCRASTFRNRNAVSAQGGTNARVLWQGTYNMKSSSQWLECQINGGRLNARVGQIKASHGGHTPFIGILYMEIGMYADSGANEIARLATITHNVYGHQAWLPAVDLRHNFTIEPFSYRINYGEGFLQQQNNAILGRVTKNSRTFSLRIIAKFKIQLAGTDTLVDFIPNDAANRLEFTNVNDALYISVKEWRGSNAIDG